MGGKGSAPAAPDYTPVAQSSVESAAIAAQSSKDALDWSKAQYADQAPYTKKYMDSMSAQTDAQTANAASDRQRYQNIYQPTEDKFVKEANDWNTPARADQRAGAAEADVANQYDAARKASTANLEGFGIDPTQTRYGALDLGTRISQAAASSGAGTQSRQNSEATGLALQGEAINIGKGYPGQVAQSYAGATSAGASGTNAGLNQTSTFSSAMGSPTAWGQVGANYAGTATGALKAGGDYNLAATGISNQASAATGQTAGALAGAAIGAVALVAI